ALHAAELEKGMQQPSPTLALARHYLHLGKKEEANRIVSAALQKFPNETSLKFMQLVVTDRATPEQLARFYEKEGEGAIDPVTRALERARLQMVQKKEAEAYTILLDAEKANPNSVQLLEGLFNYGLDTRKWDIASQYADKLGKLDWDQAGGAYYRARLKLAQRDPDGALD